ncbi:hypothetical protein HAX54_028896 [Datura stramonium]|uniref:Uncharacterized protein n=1 Tax=Datura stramonium TaxID=4076 RepID=A0ABS8V896_DATST|nr:hypothetical protein [Datura stramonium]
MTDRVMLPPNLGWGRRRGRGIPTEQTVNSVTENVVIPPSQPQNGTTADMIAAMFQQAMESLVEKIQTQPQTSTSKNGAPTNSAAYAARDNSRPAGRGAGNKSTSDRGSGVVDRGQSQVFALARQDIDASNAIVIGTLLVCLLDEIV